MKGIIGFAILIGFNFAGVWVHNAFHIPLPGNVLGLVLFLAALGLKIVRLEWVETAAELLLKHMLLFFIPYVVGIMAFFPVLGAHWVSIFAGIIGSTLAVLYVTGLVAKKMQDSMPTKPVPNKVRKEEAA
ncbi:CidA/LrgA family protein [Paenibacillus sp. 1001270B_150601_E10]|uniref:CidA/LrgA family protein n=1 Tax=Paenibacillus sp. 1001270B_150601_E10 TaxID=2787079 RepID=UPI001E436E30|nr:CidA/LrgA family protein [Paenibacillus sp. 1001270B_150601_E10]